MELDPIIAALCGEEFTCKTTMGLSFPKPLSHLDIDVGGFKRAAWRIDATNIETHSFPKPLTDADIAKMKGIVTTTISTRAVTAIPKKVEGMKELWQKIIDQFVSDCVAEELRSIVVDSATLLYKIGCDAYLQELQEKQLIKWKSANPNTQFNENDFREKLQPLEYGVVYDRLQRIYHTSRSYRKNLILIHYPTDEYGTLPDGKGGMVEGKTGRTVMDGYKDTGKFSDLVAWLSIKSQMVPSDPKNPQSPKRDEKYPVAKITKCGIEGTGLAALGLEIPATYEGLVNQVNMLKGIANVS
ncbi:hypothetical protein LCGC14_0409000 [marine sediment metagenome]|uniref:Uncharacterized protein n=1 Tax=marine sediment metagenome TaxID=412755 RepID=A0A0F9W3L7_9ZZZZ